MSAGVWIGIGLFGGFFSVARFLFDGAIASGSDSSFPFGTLAVNLTGALVLGVVAGSVVGKDALSLLTIGALGSFTTFSTWMFEAQRLAEDGETRLATINVLASLALGVALAWLGLQVGQGL
jgi:fluoride exporter